MRISKRNGVFTMLFSWNEKHKFKKTRKKTTKKKQMQKKNSIIAFASRT